MGTGGSFPGVKRPGREADHSGFQGQENVDLCIHSPIRLHGIVLNWLSRGTTLPLPYISATTTAISIGLQACKPNASITLLLWKYNCTHIYIFFMEWKYFERGAEKV
jgi:hypothetical protein